MLIIDSNKISYNATLKEIAAMELECINKAKNGRKYNHLFVEMKALTDKYLLDCLKEVKAPLDYRQRLTQPLALSGDPVKKYKQLVKPASDVFNDVDLGEVFYMKEYDNYTTRTLQAILITAVNKYNRLNGTAHCYETHISKNEVRLKRVG